jgi:hypothetical protein
LRNSRVQQDASLQAGEGRENPRIRYRKTVSLVPACGFGASYWKRFLGTNNLTK